MTMPRIVVAGTHSGVGKTTIATGIMAALRRRGLRVQGFKIGPDFIDPTFHHAATQRAGRNLDGWMLSREVNLQVFAQATSDADVAVIEGVMGLFDAKDGSLAGSTAEMAMWLDAAVVLVLDASAMAGSAAALVHGFDTLIPELRLSSVIANRIASAKHYEHLRQAVKARCRPALIGYILRDAALSLPERHLGLHGAAEALSDDKLRRLAECIEAQLDLDWLLTVSMRPKAPECGRSEKDALRRTRIGVACDSAFCFYYNDNLDLLRALGAELVAFSPVADPALPPRLDGLYLGGGYPELHAPALTENAAMRSEVAEFAESGAPVYAECGGFMYLAEAIVDAQGRAWPMAGVFPTIARMQARLARLGYVEVQACGETAWPPDGVRARGHEFRYSLIDPMPETVARIYRNPAEGYKIRSTVASYIHLHFLSCPPFAKAFVDACARRRSRNSQ